MSPVGPQHSHPQYLVSPDVPPQCPLMSPQPLMTPSVPNAAPDPQCPPSVSPVGPQYGHPQPSTCPPCPRHVPDMSPVLAPARPQCVHQSWPRWRPQCPQCVLTGGPSVSPALALVMSVECPQCCGQGGLRDVPSTAPAMSPVWQRLVPHPGSQRVPNDVPSVLNAVPNMALLMALMHPHHVPHGLGTSSQVPLGTLGTVLSPLAGMAWGQPLPGVLGMGRGCPPSPGVPMSLPCPQAPVTGQGLGMSLRFIGGTRDGVTNASLVSLDHKGDDLDVPRWDRGHPGVPGVPRRRDIQVSSGGTGDIPVSPRQRTDILVSPG